MKKLKEIAAELLKIISVSALSLFCIADAACVKEAVRDAVMRCLTTIVPSLYAMLIVSGILMGSGIFRKIPRPFALPGKLLRMEPDVFFTFLFSQLAGYPVGTRMLCAAAEKNSVSKRRAELLMGVCFGAGPAFIFGCISSQLYSSETAGKLILISSVGANLILALIISFISEKNYAHTMTQEKFRLSGDILTESIVGAGRSMAVICFTITAFSVLCSFIRESGILEWTSGLISGTGLFAPECSDGFIFAFLDVTYVNELPRNNYEILPVICGLSAFGGVCVLLQISAVCSGKLSIKPLILTRAAAGVLSGVICRIIMPFFIAQETVSVSDTNIAVHSASTPIPSIILLIMTFIVFSEMNKLSERKNKAGNS